MLNIATILVVEVFRNEAFHPSARPPDANIAIIKIEIQRIIDMRF